MEFELDGEQLAFRDEVREFLRSNLTPELVAERAASGYMRRSAVLSEFQRKVGEKGWYGLNWPKEYGGLELPPIYLHILVSEFQYWGAPAPDLTVTSVAPMMQAQTDLNLFMLAMMNKQISGSLYGSESPRVAIPKLLNLYRDGILKLDELITKTYTLDQVNEGYADLEAGKIIRGALTFS